MFSDEIHRYHTRSKSASGTLPRRPEPRPDIFGSAPDWATINVREDKNGQWHQVPLAAVLFITPRDAGAGIWAVAWRDDDGDHVGETCMDQILISLNWHPGMYVDREEGEQRWQDAAARLPSPSGSVH